MLRAAFYVLLFGAAVTMTVTRHITLALVFHIALSWSVIVVWQALAGAAIILPAVNRRVNLARAFELLFLAYVPWAFYGFTMTALALVADLNVLILVIALIAVPIAWTSVLIAAYCRTALGATDAGARRLTLAHQAMIWGGTLAYVWFAIGGWTPALDAVGL